MKRIKKARIQFITLCPRGRNQMPVLYKADGTVAFDALTKATEDAGELTNIVYTPERPDTDNHLASAEVIKDMAHSFQKEGGQIDIRHDGKAVGPDQAYVAESFIVQKGDPRFADYTDYNGNAVDATGAWATVIKIDDPELRRLYREGEWNGVSMFGQGLLTVEKADEEEAPGWFTKFLSRVGIKNINSTTPIQEINVEKQELQEILKADREALVADLVKALKPEPTIEETNEDITKEDDIDLTDPKALREQAEKLEKEEAIKNLDLSDPKALRAYADSLEKADDDSADDSADDAADETADDAADENIEKEDDDADAKLIDELRAKLRKAEIKQGSRQTASADSNEDEVYADFSKEETAAIKQGSRMAQFNNKEHGFTA
jgi:hypothetical protein